MCSAVPSKPPRTFAHDAYLSPDRSPEGTKLTRNSNVISPAQSTTPKLVFCRPKPDGNANSDGPQLSSPTYHHYEVIESTSSAPLPDVLYATPIRSAPSPLPPPTPLFYHSTQLDADVKVARNVRFFESLSSQPTSPPATHSRPQSVLMASRLQRDRMGSGGKRLRPTDSLRLLSRKQSGAGGKSKSAGSIQEESGDSDVEETDRDSVDVDQMISRAKLCRRQTVAYQRQEVAFKSRRRPQLFELAVLVALKTPEQIVADGRTIEPIYVGSRLIPTVTLQVGTVRPDLLLSLPLLCYPDFNAAQPVGPDYADELFVVTLTDDKGGRTFAYCLRFLRPEANLPEVAVVVSPVQSADFYFRLIAESIFRLRLGANLFGQFLEGLLPRPFPAKPADVDAIFGGAGGTGDQLSAVSNVSSGRFLLCSSQDCAATLQYIGPTSLITIVTALLCEKRILLVGDCVPLLARTVQAVVALLYPLEWPHTLIPVVPAPFVEVCHSPTPYLIGVLRSQLHRLKELLVGGANQFLLVVDVDMGVVRDVDYPDVPRLLPPRAVRHLRAQLDSLELSAGDVLSGKSTGKRADLRLRDIFLRLFVDLLGHFSRHLVVQQDGAKVFMAESFVTAPKSRAHRHFLRWFVETGIFQVWREKKLEKNADDTADPFDLAVVQSTRHSNNSLGDLLKQIKLSLTRS